MASQFDLELETEAGLPPMQVDYDPEILDSYVSNPKKGFKRRQAKVVEEDDEEEEEAAKLAVYEAEPFNHDVEALDPDYDPKHAFPLPSEVHSQTFCLFLYQVNSWVQIR